MASGVAAGLSDKLKTATANVVTQRPTSMANTYPGMLAPKPVTQGPPTMPPSPTSNPFNGEKLAEYKNSQTSGNLAGGGGTWSAKLVPNATPTQPPPTPTGGPPVTGNGATPPSGINNIQYNPNNIFTPGSNGGYDPAAQEKAYLQMQLDALGGQQKSAQLATQFGVDTNKAYLAEQLAGLQKQNNVDNDQAQQLQNRRGGFYSGGLDTQLSSIGQGYADAQGGVTRDVAARNQQLLDQYGNQANSIAQQIQELQSASPDIIRQRIQSWIDNERNYGLDYANTFGNLNGQQTQSQQNQNFNQQFAQDQFNYGKTQDQIQNEAQYAGQYNGNQTIQQQQQNIQNQAQYAGQYNGQNTVGQDQQQWDNRFNYGQAIGQFGNGQQTQSYQQQQIANKQWQDTFDRGKYESDRSYQQQKQQEAISNGQWQQTFNQDVEKMGFDQASELWSQSFQQNQANIKNSQDSADGVKPRSASPNEVQTLLENLQIQGQDSEGKGYGYIPGKNSPSPDARKKWVQQAVQTLVDANYDNATIAQVLRKAGISPDEENDIFGSGE